MSKKYAIFAMILLFLLLLINLATAETIIISGDSTPIVSESDNTTVEINIPSSDFDRLVALTANLIRLERELIDVRANDQAKLSQDQKKLDVITSMFYNMTSVVGTMQERQDFQDSQIQKKDRQISKLEQDNVQLQLDIKDLKSTAWTWAIVAGTFVAIVMRVFRALKRGKFEAIRLRIIARWPFATGAPDYRDAKPDIHFDPRKIKRL